MSATTGNSTGKIVNRPNPTNIKRRPKISVILPCYNEEERILDTLTGLIRQSVFKDTEILVVEYNPENNPYVRDLVDRMAHVRYMTVNRPGIAYARHVGIMNSYSDCVVNFDADCEFMDRDGLDKMSAPVLNKECVLTVCDNAFDLLEVSVDELSKMDIPSKVLTFLNNLQRTTPIAVLEPGSCINKQAYQYVGGYDDIRQYELFMLNNRLMYHYNNMQSLLFSGEFTGVHKKHINDVVVIVSSRRAVAWSERGLAVLDYVNAYR